ncbi:MAG: hypothetical protein ACLFUJ_11680 [Phycisphaerae bacterium]
MKAPAMTVLVAAAVCGSLSCAPRSQTTPASAVDPAESLGRKLELIQDQLDEQLAENESLRQTNRRLLIEIEHLRSRDKILSKQLSEARFDVRMLGRQIDALKNLKHENKALKTQLEEARQINAALHRKFQALQDQ